MHEAPYILPTGERMNPTRPETATYYDKKQVAFILRPIDGKRATRVFTSYGGLGVEWAIGTEHLCRHDQTRAILGEFVVVGVADYRTNTRVGDVPDRKLAHSVFK